MKTIILDTNVTMLAAAMDIKAQLNEICHTRHTIAVLESTKRELSSISLTQRGKQREKAKFALKYIERSALTVLPSDTNYVDDALIAYASLPNVLIATVDGELKKRLRALKKQCIVPRGQKRFMLVE